MEPFVLFMFSVMGLLMVAMGLICVTMFREDAKNYAENRIKAVATGILTIAVFGAAIGAFWIGLILAMRAGAGDV